MSQGLSGGVFDSVSSCLKLSAMALCVNVVLVDKSKTKMKTGMAAPQSSVWTFGSSIGMLELTTSHASGGGYIFRHGARAWKSNLHSKLTFEEVGVRNGDQVEYLGDFEPPKAVAASMDLKVTLSDLSKSVTRFCKASQEKSVWSFGEEVGMLALTTSAQSKGGYIFRHNGKSWRSGEHPKLTLAEAKVCSGDAVEFLGDFEPFGEQPAAAMTIDVEVRFRDKAKTWAEAAKAPVDQCVWRLGEDLGMRKLTTSSLVCFGM